MRVSVSEVQKNWRIRVGTTNIFGGDLYRIDDMVIHPEFARKLLKNDVALLKTRTTIKMKKDKAGFYIVNSICLPEVEEEHVGKATIAGWGMTRYEDSR